MLKARERGQLNSIRMFSTRNERGMDETVPYPKKAWLAWEKLRILYNLVMLGVGLPCLWLLWLLEESVGQSYGFFSFWCLSTGLFGVVANAFYCLGPLAEVGVYRVLRLRIGRARYGLFAPGLLLSMGVELALLRRLLYHLVGYLR